MELVGVECKNNSNTAFGGHMGRQEHFFDARNMKLHNSIVLLRGTFPKEPLREHEFEQHYGVFACTTLKLNNTMVFRG